MEDIIIGIREHIAGITASILAGSDRNLSFYVDAET